MANRATMMAGMLLAAAAGGAALAADLPGQKVLVRPSDLPKPYASPAVANNDEQIPRPPGTMTSLTTGLVDSYSDFVNRILSATADVLNMAERAAANGEQMPTGELASLSPEITAFTERLRFNVIYQGPQKFACTQLPLEDIKAIRQKCGASVNDVVLALVTATVRRYCELHGDPVKGKLLRIMVPVNLRGDASPSELGNRISLVPVTIPLDIRQPLKLLAAVR